MILNFICQDIFDNSYNFHLYVMDIIFKIDDENKFKTVSEEILKHMYDKKNDSEILNQHLITTATEDIKKLIITNSFNIQKINEILLLQGYDEERINILLSLIQDRRIELIYLTLIHINSSYGETVAKFDWVLKLIFGTSELKKLKCPLLQLSLTTINKEYYRQNEYDINKGMLRKMINVLENIEFH